MPMNSPLRGVSATGYPLKAMFPTVDIVIFPSYLCDRRRICLLFGLWTRASGKMGG
jgi:hypothetical protein